MSGASSHDAPYCALIIIFNDVSSTVHTLHIAHQEVRSWRHNLILISRIIRLHEKGALSKSAERLVLAITKIQKYPAIHTSIQILDILSMCVIYVMYVCANLNMSLSMSCMKRSGLLDAYL